MQFHGDAKTPFTMDASISFMRNTTVSGSGVSIAATLASESLRFEMTPLGGLPIRSKEAFTSSEVENGAVVEFHVRAQLEGEGQLVRRRAPALGNVGNDVGVVVRFEPQQRRIVRRHALQDGEGLRSVTVVGRRLSNDREWQYPAALRLLRDGWRHGCPSERACQRPSRERIQSPHVSPSRVSADLRGYVFQLHSQWNASPGMSSASAPSGWWTRLPVRLSGREWRARCVCPGRTERSAEGLACEPPAP